MIKIDIYHFLHFFYSLSNYLFLLKKGCNEDRSYSKVVSCGNWGWIILFRILFVKERESPPKCLVCGATNITSINVRDLDYYNPGPDKELIGFKHPNCGGELWLIRDPIRWNVKFTPQLYDVEGNRINLDLL